MAQWIECLPGVWEVMGSDFSLSRMSHARVMLIISSYAPYHQA